MAALFKEEADEKRLFFSADNKNLRCCQRETFLEQPSSPTGDKRKVNANQCRAIHFFRALAVE